MKKVDIYTFTFYSLFFTSPPKIAKVRADRKASTDIKLAHSPEQDGKATSSHIESRNTLKKTFVLQYNILVIAKEGEDDDDDYILRLGSMLICNYFD